MNETDRHSETLPAPTGLADASALARRPRVVVVGAGIAGLAAAAGLCERGVSVDVVEARDYLGGRVGGWPDTLSDGSVASMNRGFHAFFRQYYNLRALLRRADPHLSALTPVDDYPLIDALGRLDTFRGLPRTPPLNALAFAIRSPTFRLRDLVRLNGKAATPLVSVSVPKTILRSRRPRRRNLPAGHQLSRRCTASGFRGVRPQLLRKPEYLSAGELATMFHIYFLGSSEGLIFDVADANFDVALWNPLRKYLEDNGVRFHTGLTVDRICADADVRVSCGADTEFAADAVVLATDVAGLRHIVAESPGLGDDEWRPGSPTCTKRHRSSCCGCGWTARCAPIGRLSLVPVAVHRWTTSVSWSVTNAKRRNGPHVPVVRSWSCTPIRYATRTTTPTKTCATPWWHACTTCTRKP